MENWKAKADWGRFYERIIETNGNTSTQDAQDCGIPFGAWLELATRTDSKKLVEVAKKNLEKAKEYTKN